MSIVQNHLKRWLPVAIWMVAIYLLSAQSSLPRFQNDLLDLLVHSAGHISEYAVLSYLVARAINTGNLRAQMLITLLVVLLCALSDEWHQSFVPGRDASVFDLLMDALGATLGALAFFRRRKSGE